MYSRIDYYTNRLSLKLVSDHLLLNLKKNARYNNIVGY